MLCDDLAGWYGGGVGRGRLKSEWMYVYLCLFHVLQKHNIVKQLSDYNDLKKLKLDLNVLLWNKNIKEITSI